VDLLWNESVEDVDHLANQVVDRTGVDHDHRVEEVVDHSNTVVQQRTLLHLRLFPISSLSYCAMVCEEVVLHSVRLCYDYMHSSHLPTDPEISYVAREVVDRVVLDQVDAMVQSVAYLRPTNDEDEGVHWEADLRIVPVVVLRNGRAEVVAYVLLVVPHHRVVVVHDTEGVVLVVHVEAFPDAVEGKDHEVEGRRVEYPIQLQMTAFLFTFSIELALPLTILLRIEHVVTRTMMD
jgi:hypothetical protein